MNKVICREYVEKNYIKKSDLKRMLDAEFRMIEELKIRDPAVVQRMQLDGATAAYKAIANIFLGEKR